MHLRLLLLGLVCSAPVLPAAQWLYVLRPAPRLQREEAWTPEDSAVVGRHFAHLKAATARGQVVFGGRTDEPLDRTFGLVVFEAENEDAARHFMESDPAIVAGVMTAELHPYALALVRDPAAAVAADEAEAIRRPALDYAAGWYSGDAARMEQALHPELAKREVVRRQDASANTIEAMGALRLVQGTRAGIGRRPEDQQRAQVTIVDRYEDMAMVRLEMNEWVDYLQVARVAPGRWLIVNVLWQTRPSAKAP